MRHVNIALILIYSLPQLEATENIYWSLVPYLHISSLHVSVSVVYYFIVTILNILSRKTEISFVII